MKPIQEQRVKWDVLTDPKTIDLPLYEEDFPVTLQVFYGPGQLVREAVFEKPPVLLSGGLQPGRYRCVVLSHGTQLFSKMITC
ncbi:hypothetical protein [Phaeodactylibacter sp.]|uniref:hypothetical protein n=1 Tax=Phaeodactylibacter sp. TaxID=1940289 RepID=UPI0025EBAD79|nr:hypothetical protein [Phaeodactylibacter sp.]MCI4651443.1 hypothetical protein [Phaeodactylibacter sp.]MCI5092886.1 hypothetical protein [Phaeodactylibacter sp.]